MSVPHVTIEHAVEVLNRGLAADPSAFQYIFSRRAIVNEKLAADPTIQVIVDDGESKSLGALGIINGIFGIDGEGWGHIAMVTDDEHKKIICFEQRVPPAYTGPRCNECGCPTEAGVLCMHAGCQQQRDYEASQKPPGAA